MEPKQISTIERKLGYTFKDKNLLVRAFTHSSASRDATKNYESLEFLGDSILDFIVAKKLMAENPDAHEGALTHRRAEIVSQAPLEAEVDKLGIAQFLIVGRGEKLDNIIDHTKVKSNLFEAVVGAIFLDGGIDCAEKFILAKLKAHFDGSVKHDGECDFKTELNEFASKNKVNVEYVTAEQSGAAHCPTFKIDVLIDGIFAGRGIGKSKKSAEQQAAAIALSKIYPDFQKNEK